jgi:hypothetical protein
MPSSVIPREYLGRARLLRSRIAATDLAMNRTLREIHDLLVSELRQRDTLSPTVVTRARILWRRIPGEFGATKLRSTRHSFKADGCWLVSGTYHHPEWRYQDEERGIIIVTVSVNADRHGVGVRIDPLLNLGLHSLSRWYERASETSEAALRGGLVALLKASGRCPWPSPAGFWLGEDHEVTVANRTCCVRVVRTFVNHDMAFADQQAAA